MMIFDINDDVFVFHPLFTFSIKTLFKLLLCCTFYLRGNKNITTWMMLNVLY